MMGMEDKMPDIASFQGRGADVLGSMTPVLAMVAKQLEVPTSVRFKDPARAKQYRASLSSFMDTAQEYMVSPSEPANQQAFASALEKNERTLLETVRFDGRFAGKQQEIQERLDQASRQRVETAKTADETAKDASKTMEEKETARNNADGTADRFIRYLADLTSATVALHQTSDSFISAQMAKSGWQDRAPYMSSPETEALLSTSQGTGNYVEGKRPSMVTGRSSPMLFGSNSDALYMKGAEFKVPPPMEQPIQLPYANDTNKPEERFANAEYLFSHHSQTLRSISPPKDVLDQIDNIEKAFQDLKKDSSNENNVRIAEDFTQRIQKLADAAAPLIKKNSSLAAAFNKKKR